MLLSRTIRGSVEHTPSLEKLSFALRSQTDLDGAAVAAVAAQAIVHLASLSEEKLAEKSDAVNQFDLICSVGRLVDLKWKLGLAMSSSRADTLHTPFVTLVLTVSDNRGDISIHSLELTLSEFGGLSKSLKEIASEMGEVV